jgi:hypothetical protein
MSAALVQSTSKYTGSSTTLAFGASNTAGNLLVVAVEDAGGGTLGDPTIADSQGNAYTKAANHQQSACGVWIFYAKNCAAGANTVTVTQGANGSDMSFHISEWSGCDASAPLEDSDVGGNGGTSNSTPDLTLAGAGVIVAIVGNAQSGTTHVAGSGYSTLTNQNGANSFTEYQVIATGGTYAVTATGPNVQWTMASAAFKVSASDTTPPTITGASIDATGGTLTVNYSEAVTGVSAADYSVSGYHALGAASGSGSTRTFALTPVVPADEVVKLSYVAGGTVDLASNALAGVSGVSVTNDSTADPAVILDLRMDAASGTAIADSSAVGGSPLWLPTSGTGSTPSWQNPGIAFSSNAVKIDYLSKAFAQNFTVRFRVKTPVANVGDEHDEYLSHADGPSNDDFRVMLMSGATPAGNYQSQTGDDLTDCFAVAMLDPADNSKDLVCYTDPARSTWGSGYNTITASVGPAGIKLYVNGTLEGSAAVRTRGTTAAVQTKIGCEVYDDAHPDQTGNHTITATLKDFAVWNGQLSDAAVAADVGVTGSTTKTLAALTASAVASAPASAALSSTLAAATSTSAGTSAITGATSATLAAATSVATATSTVTGSASAALSALTASAAGSSPITASATRTLAGLTASAAASSTIIAAASASLASLGLSAAAVAPVVGSLARTLGNVTLIAAGPPTSARTPYYFRLLLNA